jgi:hypothetical protein
MAAGSLQTGHRRGGEHQHQRTLALRHPRRGEGGNVGGKRRSHPAFATTPAKRATTIGSRRDR